MNDIDEKIPDNESDWLDELAEARVVAPSSVPVTPEPVVILPPLDRERPVRPPVVAPRVFYIAAGAAAFVVAAALIWILVARSVSVTVPEIVGQSMPAATAELKKLGLTVTVAERRFSTQPKDEVLDQTPVAGSELRKGQSVAVIVSAGTEEFTMPDVLMNSLELARNVLEEKGLVVAIETVMSEQASDTVLATDPAPGSVVRTGQTVRVQVASPSGSTGSLQPYTMSGLSVVIDPAPSSGASDPSLEVARRLQALLEASGATVRATRTGNDTSTADSDRAARVAETSSTIGIGLQIVETGQAGRVISAPATTTPFIGPSSSALANALEKSFTGSMEPFGRTLPSAQDPVLGGVNMPWVRITLGSNSVPDDVSSFANTGWADVAARAIYRALGEVYGTRSAQ